MVATPGVKKNFQSVAAFARPGDVIAYDLRDVVSDDSESSKALVFPGCSKSGVLTHVRLSIEQVDVALSFSLYLFDSEPTNFADNATLVLLDSDIEKLIGRWDFPNSLIQDSGTWSIFAIPATTPEPFASIDSNLYGLLIAMTGYTPASAAKVNIRLQGTHDLL